MVRIAKAWDDCPVPIRDVLHRTFFRFALLSFHSNSDETWGIIMLNSKPLNHEIISCLKIYFYELINIGNNLKIFERYLKDY